MVDGTSNSLAGLNPASGALIRTPFRPCRERPTRPPTARPLDLRRREHRRFQVNAFNGDVQKRLSLQRGSFTACEFAQGSLWLADALSNKILRVDPETAEVLGSFNNPGTRIAGLAFDGIHFWVSDPATLTIYELDSIGTAGSKISFARAFAPGPGI